MPIGYRNLSTPLKGMVNPGLDVGQIHYLVDPNFRTSAQGWSRPDGTGVLDLWAERNPGFVFYGAGAGAQDSRYATDAAALQGAIDAMIDFRGDTLFFTPGNYSIATARTIDVPDARWLGPAVSDPVQCRATITAAVANALTTTAAADRMEVGFLRFVPLTAANMWSVVALTDNLHFHDFLYDTNGITASTATTFLDFAGASLNSVFDRFTFFTDDSQGPMFVISDFTTLRLRLSHFYHYHVGANALAISLVDDNSATAAGIIVGPGFGLTGGAGAVTTMYDLVNKTLAETNVTIREFDGSVQYATATTLVTSAGAVNDIDLVDCWIATVEGGAGRAAYVGAA